MRTTSLPVQSLVDKIGRGEILLPEIQRAYVWKPSQVAGLIDSLYRSYPSGSLLLWETDLLVRNRDLASSTETSPANKPLYLLDGQQRLTSLHRVFSGHQDAIVVFNVEAERFQLQSAATSKDPRYVAVQPILANTTSLLTLTNDVSKALPNVPMDDVLVRLQAIQKIRDYPYHLEIVEGLGYEEVTRIFTRVNSRGRTLKTTDLALATLSARWPGAVDRFDKLAATCASNGFAGLDTTFLVRALAALVDPNAHPVGFATVDVPSLTAAWARLEHALDWLVQLLHDVGIRTSGLVPSINALVPAVAYLARKDDKLDEHQAKALVYWLFGAWLSGRFSYSAQSTITQDVKALDNSNPLSALWKNLGLVGRLSVAPGDLAGKGAGSNFFLLSYLVCQRATAGKAAAKDWWHHTSVSTGATGAFKIEYHHIHPRATLKSLYSKAEINDLANLAFISSKANRKISDRSPAKYFTELSDTEMSSHFVPSAIDLRTADAYPAFVAARRSMLADAMTDLLDGYRPDFVEPTSVDSPHLAPIVWLTAYGTLDEPASVTLAVEVYAGELVSISLVRVSDLNKTLEDVADGLGTELIVNSSAYEIPPGVEVLQVPAGAVQLYGTVEEWRSVLQRELAELLPTDQMPTSSGTTTEPPAPPIAVHITETE